MSGREPFFSVVIPALNEERYLPRLLESLAKQLDRDFEVIVVDGKSEDKTVVRADQYKRRLGLKILAVPRRNVSLQRNTGARAARGGWLVFLDADTRVPANYLSEMHHYILKNRKSRFLTTWACSDSESDSDKVLTTAWNLMVEMANSLDRPVGRAVNMAIKKKLFWETGGFDESLLPPKKSEDEDLAKRLAKKGVKMNILRWLKVEVSLRRFRREGTLSALRKYAMLTFRTYLDTPLTKKMLDFEMGGKVKSRRKKKFSTSIKKYSRRIKEALVTELGQL